MIYAYFLIDISKETEKKLQNMVNFPLEVGQNVCDYTNSWFVFDSSISPWYALISIPSDSKVAELVLFGRLIKEQMEKPKHRGYLCWYWGIFEMREMPFKNASLYSKCSWIYHVYSVK